MRPLNCGFRVLRSIAVLLLAFTAPPSSVSGEDRLGGKEDSAFLTLRLSPKLDELGDGVGIDPATGQTCAGDPSLVLNTNIALGEKKSEFMKAASKAVADGLGKPESFVAVSVSDGQHIMWGGEETPCALGTLYSLGAINHENNKKVSAAIAELLGDLGVPSNRMYVSCFDVARENMMYNGATFAG